MQADYLEFQIKLHFLESHKLWFMVVNPTQFETASKLDKLHEFGCGVSILCL